MPQQDNILSVPTSYAVPKPAPVQMQSSTGTQVAAQGVRPSQINFQNASSNHREAIAAVEGANQENIRAMSMLSGKLADKFKEMQDEEFAQGYMRHMQGESVAEIAKDKPFFGIFGDGGAVRGAQARQTENAGQALVQYVQQNQGELTKLTLDEQRTALAKFVSDLGTDDPVADRMIAEGAMKVFPSMLDNLARASEAENQRGAAVAQADTMKQAGEAMNYARSQVAVGQMSASSYEALQNNFLEASKPLPGQSPDSYRAALTGNIMELTKNGNFEAANLLRNEILDVQLDPTERLQLDAQMKSMNAEWLKDNPLSMDYTSFVAQAPTQIEAGRYNSQASLYADIDRFNADYKVQTGNLKPLIDNEEKAKLGARWDAWQLKDEAANDKLAAAAEDENVKRSAYAMGFAKGSPSQMAASGLDAKAKAAMEQNETAKFLTEQGNTSAVTVGRLAVNGHVIAPLKEQLSGTLGILKGGGIPKEDDLIRLQTAYLKFQNTPYGMGAAEQYFGDDLELVKQMSGMDMSKRENQQWVRERAQATTTKTKPTEEMQKTASDLVDSEIKPGWWGRTFGDAQEMGAGFELQAKEEMKAHAADVLSQYPNMSEEEVLKMASARTMQNKDVAGNMLITGGKKGEFFQTLNSHLNIKMQSPTDTRINTIVNEGIRAKVPAQFDFTVGSLNALPNGKVFATVVRENGVSQSMVLDIADMANIYNQKKVKAKSDDKQRRADYQLEKGVTDAYKASERAKQQPMR